MIKAIIFDFGGVVHTIVKKDIRGMIADLYKLPPDLIKDKLREYAVEMSKGIIDEKEFWEKLSKSLKAEIPTNWQNVWREKTTSGNSVNNEILDLVRNLKQQAYRVVVLSNIIPPHADEIREKGWYEPFDKLYLSHEIGYRKPDIEAYKLVLREEGLRGEECIYIDDIEENLEPARILGMKTVLAVTPDQVVRDVMASIN